MRVALFGATSAIASDVARKYAERGARLFCVGRNPDKLRALCEELGDHVVGSAASDFDDLTAAQDSVKQAIDALGGIDVAVIAHGLLGDQLQSERDVGVAQQILHTNAQSVIALLVPLANHMEQARGGRLAVLSSVAADRGRPRNYTYGAAKSALNTYLQGLRSRLRPAGVTVHTLKLGPVDTPMTADHDKNPLFATSERAARDIVAALDRRVAEAYVPWFWRGIMAVVRPMPEAVFQRLPFLSGR